VRAFLKIVRRILTVYYQVFLVTVSHGSVALLRCVVGDEGKLRGKLWLLFRGGRGGFVETRWQSETLKRELLRLE
jgi:hypothetical protein